MSALLRPHATRRWALAAATVLIVAGSQLGMLWLANAYLHIERDEDVLSLEALFGVAAILLVLLSARAGLHPGLPQVLTSDRIGRWLLTFLALCIVGELLRPDRTLGHVSTFISIGAYYMIGVAVGRWFASERASMPVVPMLLAIYTFWYIGLAAFYMSGDLGFYGELPDSDVLRLEFRSGFTATELPIYVGFQLPVLLYVLLTPHGPLTRIQAMALLACATGLIYLSASAAALAALLIVLVVVVVAWRGASLANIVRMAAALALVTASGAALVSDIVESTGEKIESFVASEGVRALIYNELVNIIQTEPMGIGKSRFVQTNNFSWLGEGVFPHNNVLGIGAEMGVIAMAAFLVLCALAFVRLGRTALARRQAVPQRVRVLVAVALSVFVYQQFRGLFQDTWVVKETYFWLGIGASVALAFAGNAQLAQKDRREI